MHRRVFDGERSFLFLDRAKRCLGVVRLILQWKKKKKKCTERFYRQTCASHVFTTFAKSHIPGKRQFAIRSPCTWEKLEESLPGVNVGCYRNFCKLRNIKLHAKYRMNFDLSSQNRGLYVTQKNAIFDNKKFTVHTNT